MDYPIYSYGNGEILKGLFDAIAMCLNSQTGSLYIPLVRLSLIIGALWTALYVLFNDYIKALAGWIIPLTAITQLLFVPQARVVIIDPVSRYHQTVNHVPYGLAFTASFISRIGHSITEQVEKVFVLPDDLKYQKTGTLFASNLLQQAKTFHISNDDLAENMRQFVGQCVAYDALLGRKYTLSDLRHSHDIWALVSENASPVRAFLWRQPRELGQQGARPEIISCRVGVQRFNQQWNAELDRSGVLFGKKVFGKNPLINPKQELFRYLPVAYNQLTGMAQSAEELLKQNMMIYAVVDGIEQKSSALGNAPNFAVRRAYLQQRATYETLGAMAGEMLPTMKSVLEAVAYATFMFIIPLALLPFGYRFLFSWVNILLWLQMWAPLYAVLNYIMTMAARSKSVAALSLSNDAGVTIASSVGLVNVNADIAAMAGYLAMSIPFLCIALVKGVGSFVHLASHLSNVTQGTANSAAHDAVTGNYSFGNISQGNRQISNVNMLNHSYAASLRSGSFHQADGRSDLMTTADGQQILNVTSSNVPVTINAAETRSAQLSQQASQHHQNAINQSAASSKNLSSSYRDMVDLSEHISQNQHLSDQVNSGSNIEHGKSIQKATQMIENFAKDNNLSKQQAADILADASISAGTNNPLSRVSLGVGASGKLSGNAFNQEIYNKAERLSQSTDFQETMREAKQASQSLSHSMTDDTGRRLSENISGSYEKSEQFRTEAIKSLRTSEDYQRQAAFTHASAASINANYTQEFVGWLAEQRADNTGGKIGMHGASHIMANEPSLRMSYAEQFMNEKGLGPKIPSKVSNFDQKVGQLKTAYDNESSVNANNVNHNAINDIQSQAKDSNLNWNASRANDLRQDVANRQQGISEGINIEQGALSADYNQAGAHFTERKNKAVLGQALSAEWQHASSIISPPESAPLMGSSSSQGAGWEHSQKTIVNNQTKIIQKEEKSFSKEQQSSDKGESQSNI